MQHAHHLDDEHMRLYEWNGAGPGIVGPLTTRSKRSHPWHASYGVLAVLTTLLILGCDNKDRVGQAGAPVDQAAEGVQEPITAGPLSDTTPAAPAATPGPAAETAPPTNPVPAPSDENQPPPGAGSDRQNR